MLVMRAWYGAADGGGYGIVESSATAAVSRMGFRRDRKTVQTMAVSVIPNFRLLVVLLCTVFGVARAELPPGLLDKLRDGGYVIYFRHAATDWDQHDREDALPAAASCDPQRMRQLSAEGRESARQIGAVIQTLGIPVGQVLASEYCRTAETARLLALGEVTTTRDVINVRVAHLVGGRDRLRQTARQRLGHVPAPGTNTVIVAHGNVFVLAAGTRPPEAGAAVVLPRGGDAFDVVAILEPTDWELLDSE